jgi:hypothetical protein
MVEAVRRYEGYVVQSTDDSIFALFGAPAAYEDRPERYRIRTLGVCTFRILILRRHGRANK